ncbi:opioid growth factor receptor-like protein 1 [Ruditapes philippinarum]|uniref:opioid growth factor receptor-like protein 1 n=1 Tax=Ruditapes philippinarum TaxID=129788 RepID=UPI00295B52F4|nr:opioid growth factor receptor-like protein 1 [Ruditapes philippinarum]
MHSPDNMMKEDEIQEMMKWTKALLDCLDITEKTYYKDAIAGLEDIAKKDFVIKYQSEESKNILANVKEAKTFADELHKNIEDDEQLRTSKRLLDMLESIGCFGITENKGLEYKQAEYKSKIKEVFEQKSVTIELDKAECDEESEDFKELDVLQQHTKQTLQEVEVVIKRPESEEMEVRINSLNKELESKKSQEVQLIRLKKDSEESAKTIEHLQNEVKSLEKENIVIDIEEQEDDLNLDENYKFFMNEIPSRPNGDYIDTIHKEWWGDYKRLEEDRNYMQWLFPIRGKCCDRPYQELFPHEIQKIRGRKEAQDRLLLSYKMMLDFYGMTLSDEKDGTILFTFNFDERMENLNKSEQNHNRITRILKCLGELGFEHLKKKLIKFIINQIFISKRLTNLQEICRNYWIEILKDPRERAEMKTHFENPGCLIL